MMTVRYEPTRDEINSFNEKNLEKNVEKIIINDHKSDEFSLRSSQLTIKIAEQPSTSETLDLLEFVQVRKFSDDSCNFFSSPRASHIALSEEDFFQIPQYYDTRRWFGNNVSNYLKNKELWPRHIYPERLLYIYGPRGMGRLTCTMFMCRRARVNLLFVPSSIHDISLYAKLIKKAKEMQPCLIFFDDFDPVFAFQPCFQQLYAIMNSQLNKRDDEIWIVMTGVTPPDSIPPSAKSMIADYGSITDINAIESPQQAHDLIIKMLATISRVSNYPCSQEELSNPYNKWNNILMLLSKYTQYCTIKELEVFFIKLFRTYHHQHKDDNTSLLPPIESFEQAIEEIPFIDDKSDLRSLTSTRNALMDYRAHESEWHLYTAVSGIKSAPRPPSSPGDIFIAPYSAPVAVSTPVIPPISREEQRDIERERRRQQRVLAETENILQSEYDFSNLPVPPIPSSQITEPQKQVDTFCPSSSPSHSVFDDIDAPLPLSLPPAPVKIVEQIPVAEKSTKLPTLPAFTSKKRTLPTPSLATSSNISKNTPKSNTSKTEDFLKRLRKN